MGSAASKMPLVTHSLASDAIVRIDDQENSTSLSPTSEVIKKMDQFTQITVACVKFTKAEEVDSSDMFNWHFSIDVFLK